MWLANTRTSPVSSSFPTGLAPVACWFENYRVGAPRHPCETPESDKGQASYRSVANGEGFTRDLCLSFFSFSFTPKALHSKAQGRFSAPWVTGLSSLGIFNERSPALPPRRKPSRETSRLPRRHLPKSEITIVNRRRRGRSRSHPVSSWKNNRRCRSDS